MSFFSEHELQLISPPGCGTCGLNRSCRSPRIAPTGGGRLGVLLIDSFPHAREDTAGEHLVSPRIDPLADLIEGLGYQIEDDFWRLSAVNCRIPGDKAPNHEQIDACRSYVLQTIDQLKPRLIICLGEHAASCITGHSFPPLQRGIEVVRGFIVPDQTIGTWVAFTYGVDYVERTKFDPVVKVIWQDDIRSALGYLETPFTRFDEEQTKSCIKCSAEPERILAFLDKVIEKKPVIAFDYETTGLKPHRKGHKILSVSVAVSESRAFSFTLNDNKVIERWGDVLEDDAIVKVCHNAPFELLWSNHFVSEVRGTVWDTCLLAHIDDGRDGVKGLDSQAYLRFGVRPWDTVEHKKKPSNRDAGANSFNQLGTAPLNELLLYNGLDALYTMWLYTYYRDVEGLIIC